MPKSAIGIDIGSRTVKCVRGHLHGNSFALTGFAVNELPAGSNAEIEAGWAALRLGFKPRNARIGVGGRDVNIRYTRVPRVPDWQLRKLMRFETEEVGGQSGSELASDYNVLPELPELEDEDVVLLALARESLLEQHLAGLAAQGGSLEAFTPSAVALYNAWLRFGVLMDDTVLVANIGHGTIDVVLARGADLLFARNLVGGSRLFDEAIAQRLGCSLAQAEELKREHAQLAPGASHASAQAEKVSRACLAPAGQLQSLLQSALLFCKSQIKLSGLKLDRVALCGGGAALRGLDAYLASALGAKVESFDPFRVIDSAKLSPAELEQLETYGAEAVVALGLATSSADPQAYSIEILPQSLRKKREFVGGTLFLIAAAAVGALYLGYAGWRARGELHEQRAEVARLDQRLRAARGTQARTEALVAENQQWREYALELHALAGSGAQLAHTLEALERSMPADFWLTRASTAWRFDPQLGVERAELRPIVHLEGAAREGTESAAMQFQQLVDGLRAGLPGVALKPSLSPSGTSFTIDLTRLAPAAALAAASESSNEDEDAAQSGAEAGR